MKYKELKEILIEDLEFDQRNPRLPRKLHSSRESEVIEWMLLDASLLDLIASIASNGFFPGEPLLVIENKNSNKYTVIEGNRRLASCKILNNPNIATVKSKSIVNLLENAIQNNIPNRVPAFIFDERKDILAYLGYRHVTGVKSWGALPKAKYLYELYLLDISHSSLKEKCRILAKKIGSRGDYILRLIVSYQLFLTMEENEFFGMKGLSEENIEFSNLVDAATRFGNIAKFINIDFESENPLENLDIRRFEELTNWLFKRDENKKTKLGENRNIRILNQVVDKEKALTAYREGATIKEAFLLTSLPDEIFLKSINTSYKNIKNADEVKNSLSYKISDITRDELQRIEELVKNIKSVIS